MFYQNYWDIIGKDTTKTCLGVLNEVENVSLMNKIYIFLIPNVK